MIGDIKGIGIKLKTVLQKAGQLRKQTLIRNILIVAFITLFVKGLGFFKESIVASEFGLSEQLDTFYIAMLVPGFITTVFLGSFKSVFIPNYIRELKTGNKMGSFQSTGFIIVLALSILFLVFAVLVTDIYLQNFFAGHTKEYYNLIKIQFYLIAPCIILWGLSSLISGLLNINSEFKYSSFNTIATPIVIILCVLFFKDYFGNTILAIGTLIGSIINFLYLIFIAFKRKIIILDWPDLKNTNAIMMLRQAPAKATSGFLTGLTGVTDQYFAAQLAVGSIAALNYGQKIPSFITGILIMAMGTVLLPHFSKKVVENKEKTFKDLIKMLKWLFLGSTGVAVIVIFFSNFLVKLFFERNEFTQEDTKVVSIIQSITLLYAPFAICGMVLVHFLNSINKNSFMAWVALGSMILNIIFDYIGMKFFGIYGITIASTLIVIIRSYVLLKFTLAQKKDY